MDFKSGNFPTTAMMVSDIPSELDGQKVLGQLLASSVLMIDDWLGLPEETRNVILSARTQELLLDGLVRTGLLTQFQANKVLNGKVNDLLLGNYRILDKIGAGGMGVVFKAEHIDLKRTVAIKVLPIGEGQDWRMQSRFINEMRAVAQLQHPNIVAAMDAGKAPGPDHNTPFLRYFVMELVNGADMEQMVMSRGPLPFTETAELLYQVAAALNEAHIHKLVHRDIKPSNIQVTTEGKVKLLDFGLTMYSPSRLTQPGMILGTIEFMAPEQAEDASKVDIRADIYSVGATCYWCLTGHTPFEGEGTWLQKLTRRNSSPPPSILQYRKDVPEAFANLISQMMSLKAADRPQTPREVMDSLLPFLKSNRNSVMEIQRSRRVSGELPKLEHTLKVHRVLLVDDEPNIRALCKATLEREGLVCEEAGNGAEALALLAKRPVDLIFLDFDMPGMRGIDVAKAVRSNPPCANLKIIMFSGRLGPDELSSMMARGIDDCLAKPSSPVQIQARVHAALRMKDAQDRSDLLLRHLQAANSKLETSLQERDGALVQARNALVLSLAKLVEFRDSEPGSHLVRIQRFCRVLAEAAMNYPAFAGQIDMNFIDSLEICAPLHDIGKVGLPDYILLKPEKLEPDEFIMMQSHTVIGAETLKAVCEENQFAGGFLQMAVDIVRHHHERFDGTGYPDKLAGQEIPLSARIVTVADVYDALRTRRPYKPALSHKSAVQLMTEVTKNQFDPALIEVFRKVADKFEAIFKELPG